MGSPVSAGAACAPPPAGGPPLPLSTACCCCCTIEYISNCVLARVYTSLYKFIRVYTSLYKSIQVYTSLYGIATDLGRFVLQWKVQFELWREFILRVESVREVHSPDAAVGMNLYKQTNKQTSKY